MAGRDGKPLSETANRSLIGKSDSTVAQSVSVVDPDVSRAGHQNVGGPVGLQQRIQNPGAGQFGLE